jgi:hypothetical protein
VIVFLWEEALWQLLVSRRGIGIVWTVPVCFLQAVVENSFMSRMFWFLYYREFKGTGESGQCEKALLWEKKQVRCYFITHFFSEHLPCHVQRVEILCIKIGIFIISLQIVLSWKCIGVFQGTVKVAVCAEDRNFYNMGQGPQETW